jgi:L-seryl-tRNA(Ser) seleniumtransferase
MLMMGNRLDFIGPTVRQYLFETSVDRAVSGTVMSRMSIQKTMSSLSEIISLDTLMRSDEFAPLLAEFGRAEVKVALRLDLDDIRGVLKGRGISADQLKSGATAARVFARLEERVIMRPRQVFNLTGTILHTNLGRAPLAEEAIAAMVAVARNASDLEFDLETGRRGDRDQHCEGLICELTGAQAATIVNNNAAAVTLVLNTLARRKQVPVSRGELVEIGGAFRMPDIMARAGAKLVEVGTTNRTHVHDYESAISSATSLIMKVHTSNYRIEGFSKQLSEAEISAIAIAHDLPFFVDVGSGSLVDLGKWGLPFEPTVDQIIKSGADLVSFSGDKLLGGPQAGIIAGRSDLIERIKKNPLRRALRPGKVTIAALTATLQLYRDPSRLADRLPILKTMIRSVNEIGEVAQRLGFVLQPVLGNRFKIAVKPSQCEIGSGSMPMKTIESRALVMRPLVSKGSGRMVQELARAFRCLPVPVIGRVHDNAFWLDLRAGEDERALAQQFENLQVRG